MSKKVTNDVDASALRAQLDQIAASQARAFVQQLIPPQVLIHGLRIAKSSLDNWRARKLFNLDADRIGKARLYSARDCVLLTVVYRLSTFGVPLVAAGMLGQGIADYALESIKNAMAHRGQSSAAILFRRGKRPLPGSLTDKSEWDIKIGSSRAEVVSKHPLPSVRIEIDAEEFVEEVLEVVMPGTVIALRRPARNGRRTLRRPKAS